MAYRNWSYRLNKLDNTITLNQYIGDETEVTVYDSYKIDGVTYQTKLKSRDNNSQAKYMFEGKSNIQSIIFSKNIDTSNVTNMNFMFSGCSSLVNLDISSLDTSNVTEMRYLFSNCRSLVNLDVRGLNTSSVTDICGMFSSCSSIDILDLSNFDMSNVTNISSMFSGSVSNPMNLTEIKGIENWNTQNVRYASNLFYNCKILNNINFN